MRTVEAASKAQELLCHCRTYMNHIGINKFCLYNNIQSLRLLTQHTVAEGPSEQSQTLIFLCMIVVHKSGKPHVLACRSLSLSLSLSDPD
jgi:hypothetical protein